MTVEGHAVTAKALLAKRAEIPFDIRELEKQIDRLRTELVQLDAVLRMFRPDFKAEGLPIRHRQPTEIALLRTRRIDEAHIRLDQRARDRDEPRNLRRSDTGQGA